MGPSSEVLSLTGSSYVCMGETRAAAHSGQVRFSASSGVVTALPRVTRFGMTLSVRQGSSLLWANVVLAAGLRDAPRRLEAPTCYRSLWRVTWKAGVRRPMIWRACMRTPVTRAMLHDLDKSHYTTGWQAKQVGQYQGQDFHPNRLAARRRRARQAQLFASRSIRVAQKEQCVSGWSHPATPRQLVRDQRMESRTLRLHWAAASRTRPSSGTPC